MRTKFITTLAAAALLTASSAAVALAEAPDIQASANNNNAATFANDGAYASGENVNPTNGGLAPTVGPSAHYHPHGVVHK